MLLTNVLFRTPTTEDNIYFVVTEEINGLVVWKKDASKSQISYCESFLPKMGQMSTLSGENMGILQSKAIFYAIQQYISLGGSMEEDYEINF